MSCFTPKTRADELRLLQTDDLAFPNTKAYLKPLIDQSLDQFEFHDRAAVTQRLLDAVSIAAYSYLHDPNGGQVEYSLAAYFSWYIGDVLSTTHKPVRSIEPQTVDDLHDLFSQTVALLEADDGDAAGILFNIRIKPRYRSALETRAFQPMMGFYLTLDEYHNGVGARILGIATKKGVAESFYGAYRENLAEARRLEKGQQF